MVIVTTYRKHGSANGTKKHTSCRCKKGKKDGEKAVGADCMANTRITRDFGIKPKRTAGELDQAERS